MNFNKTEVKNRTELDNMIKDLDNCGDTYCGNIITSEQLKEEGHKFLKKVTAKCRSTVIPKNSEENRKQFKEYDKCFTAYKKRSKYNKRLTQRKKCEDKKCKVYQNKIQKKLSSVKKNNFN